MCHPRTAQTPHGRGTEEDWHPNAATSVSAQEEEEEKNEKPSNKRSRLDEGAVADEEETKGQWTE